MNDPQTIPVKNGVCVVDGYGIKISVERGHLEISDGTGRNRRHRRFTRSSRTLKRLVLVGHTGYVTLDALRWLEDTGASFVHVDEGRLLTTSTPRGTRDARLRRAQAMLAGATAGIGITRDLLTRKLRAQAALYEHVTDNTPPAPFAEAFDTVRSSEDVATVRLAEANAAKIYWQTLADIELRFAPRATVPDHWRTIGSRSSRLNMGPRNATTPAHAIWNYLYTLLEAEAVLIIHSLGLDPLVGINHADKPHRNNLALDLIEPVRPRIDAQVLQLLSTRVLSDRDFHETRDGIVRLLDPLTHELAATTHHWRPELDTTIRHAAALIAKTSDHRDLKIPHTPTNREQHTATTTERIRRTRHWTCERCGATVESERVLCEPCLAEHRQLEKLRIPTVGAKALADWKARVSDVEKKAIYARASASNVERHARLRAWVEANPDAPTDPAWYDENVRPLLKDITRAQIVAATGLNPSYASRIRNGSTVPHPMHWFAIRRAGYTDSAGTV